MELEIEKFINWVRMRSPQARTWRDYKCDLQLFLKIMKDQRVEDVRFRDVDEFVNFQVCKGFKPSTINRRLAAVASFYTYLIDDGRQLACPVLPKRHYVKEPQRLPRPVNEQDIRKFFNIINDERDRAMCSLMLRSGLRIGEVAVLKMADLYLGESPSRMIIHGKGSRERTVYLSPDAERDLNHWLEKRPKIHCEYAFVTYQNKKISTTSINARIEKIRERSGVNITAHRLRHTFADHLLSAGTPITSIQLLMGHRFVETTQNYAAANDKQVEADFYESCKKLDGWKFLMEVAQVNILENEMSADPDRSDDEKELVHFEIPVRASRLPADLIAQLEAYRQTQVNRWRTERIAKNSSNFYGQHAILWGFFSEYCKVKSVVDLRLEHVLQYIQHRLEKKYSAKGINGHLSALRSFLSFLKEDETNIHPSLEKIRRLKEAEVLPRYMTSEQMQRLQEEIEANVSNAKNEIQKYEALLLRAAFYLFWQGGLRAGEVEGLKFSDFYISIANHAKRLFVRDGKWRKGRVVYLTDMALEALKAYLAVRGVEKVGGYVFVRNNVPIKSGFICLRLQAAGRRVNVKVSPHRLRHTFATQLLNVGCKVTSIQRLLGHSNLNTTMTYARAFNETVMMDYFRAIDVIESQPDGAWHGIAAISSQE
jgi:site-specific recombinase XerD